MLCAASDGQCSLLMNAMYGRLCSRKLIPSLAVASVLGFPICSRALTITSGPVLTPATNAPLAAVLRLTTDHYSRVSVIVDDGQQSWERDFYDYDTNHSVPLLGFRAGRTNVITTTVHDRFGNEVTAPQSLVFKTAPLPGGFPQSVLLKSEPKKMEPGYVLFRVSNRTSYNGYLTVVDDAGQVVWYSGRPSLVEVRRLENGNLFLPLSTNFAEINLLGDTVDSWVVPADLPINVHEGVPTDHGTILYLNDASRVVTNLPTSTTDPGAPLQVASVLYNRVVEISATNGALLNIWSPIDVLDPTRVGYNSLAFQPAKGFDVEHANAIFEDPRDNSIIVSMRHQDAVIKFSRATGQLKWILGPHANWGPAWQPYLLTPVGTPFEWNYGQHASIITAQGTVLLYDNGTFRASPFDPPLADSESYSRAVEYRINEKTMKVSQVWDYGRTDAERLFTPVVGSAFELPRTGNILINYGSVSYVDGVPPSPVAPNATMLRIKEVTHDQNPQVVFDLAYFNFQNVNPHYLGTGAYRSRWIPDLYPVVTPARAIADLVQAVGDSASRPVRNLLPSLGAAMTAIGQRDPKSAMRWLQRFQLKTRFPRLAPGTAAQFVHQAQGIIDALEAGKSSYATERLTSVFPVFSPTRALADLIIEVGDARCRIGRPLVNLLSGALVDLGQNHPAAAVRNLRTFQKLVGIGRLDHQLADHFDFQAQRIIDVIGQGPDLKPCHLRVHTRDSKPCLEFSGNVTRGYAVEASSDMVHWERLGAARPTQNGNFEFEDAHADEFQTRFYRVVSP
jgi:arylsulfate sulfotransferase